MCACHPQLLPVFVLHGRAEAAEGSAGAAADLLERARQVLLLVDERCPGVSPQSVQHCVTLPLRRIGHGHTFVARSCLRSGMLQLGVHGRVDSQCGRVPLVVAGASGGHTAGKNGHRGEDREGEGEGKGKGWPPSSNRRPVFHVGHCSVPRSTVRCRRRKPYLRTRTWRPCRGRNGSQA